MKRFSVKLEDIRRSLDEKFKSNKDKVKLNKNFMIKANIFVN